MQTYDIYGAITIFGMGIIGGFLFGCSCEVISFAIGGIIKFFKKAYNCPEGKEDIDLILDLAFLYDKISHFDLAEKMYKRVLEIDDSNAIAYYGLGIILDDDGLYEEAIEYYKKAIENDNKYEKAYFFLANAYDELGNK